MSIDTDLVTVIVVTYNSAHCMRELSAALASHPRVIVVDNASQDNTADEVARWLPNAKFLPNAANLGFGAANNQALAQTSTPYALLLNPDCKPTPNFIGQMMAAAHRFPDAAILAPHLLRSKGTPEINYRWPSTLWRSSGPAADGPCCTGFLCGAVMLLNMERMRKVGFFDEHFFLYYEDDDLCERVFSQKEQLILCPDISIVHESRGSVGGKYQLRSEFIRGFHHAQSKIFFLAKHADARRAKRQRYETLLSAMLLLPLRLLIPQPRYLARLIGRIAGLLRL